MNYYHWYCVPTPLVITETKIYKNVEQLEYPEQDWDYRREWYKIHKVTYKTKLIITSESQVKIKYNWA